MIKAGFLRLVLGLAAMAAVACSKSPTALDQECSNGQAGSCVALGELFLAGKGVPADKEKAAMSFERACEARSASGCDKARELYQASCDQGVAGGCSMLGRMYLDGFGVTQDRPKAAEIYKKACDLGHAVSCSNLAWMYSDGLGVAADPAMAASLYRKACNGGFADACNKAPKEQQQSGS